MITLFSKVLPSLGLRKTSTSPPNFEITKKITKVFFGDSIFLRVSKNDVCAAPLSQLLIEYYGKTETAVIAHSAFALPHYLMHILCAKQRFDNVSKVVIPINYRSFSLQWEPNPLWQYSNALQKMMDKCGIKDFRIKDIVLDVDYKLAEATYFWYGRQSSKFFLQSIEKKTTSLESCIERRRRIFAFNYLFDQRVIEQSKRLNALKLIINRPINAREKLVFFVPPINYQAIDFLLGEHAVNFLKGNIGFLVNYARSLGVQVNDFSMTLDRFSFFNEFEATEHLNEVGRIKLLNNICEVVGNE